MPRMSKDLKPLYDAALAAGWREKETTDGIRLFPPNGAGPATFHRSTQAKGRTVHRVRRQLRAGGLDV